MREETREKVAADRATRWVNSKQVTAGEEKGRMEKEIDPATNGEERKKILVWEILSDKRRPTHGEKLGDELLYNHVILHIGLRN